MTPVAETISSYASGRSVTSRSIVQARTCSALPMPAGDPLRLWNSELPAAVAAAAPRNNVGRTGEAVWGSAGTRTAGGYGERSSVAEIFGRGRPIIQIQTIN